MVNYYIPDEEDKKRYQEEIEKTASFLNKKPDRQGGNQELDKIVQQKEDIKK